MKAVEEFDVGLKLWSTDSRFFPEVEKLYGEGFFDYVELYVVPGTYNSLIEEWFSFGGKYIIHCSHSGHGFNLGDPGLKGENRIKFQESQAFADALKADSIIVHLGHSGSLNEAILQLNGFSDDRICVENKPMEGLGGEVCLGNSPQEISRVLDEANVPGFVLDFGHAIYSANSLNEEKYGFVERFMSLGPKMFHLSDGLNSSTKDCHLNLGQGDLDLRRIISYIPPHARVTLETPRKKDSGLGDFTDDVDFLSDLLKK
jgi:deoxyribonuclease IV